MRRLLPLLLPLLLAAPAAADHGTEEPHITDAAGDAGAANRWGDLTAGWFHETATNLTLELEVAVLPETGPVLYTWYALADVGGATVFWGGYFDLVPGSVGFVYGTMDRAANRVLTLQEGEGTFAPGEPGTLAATLPKAFLSEAANGTLPAGASLAGIAARSGQLRSFELGIAPSLEPGTVVAVMDEATGPDLALASATPPVDEGWRWVNGSRPDASAPQPGAGEGPRGTPGLPAAAVGLGVAAAALAARRRAP